VTSRAADRTTVVEIVTDPLAPVPSSDSWWDVPVAETSLLETTRTARAAYEEHKVAQRGYLRPAATGDADTRDSSNERDGR
jgi:3D-(3,5/4)-trihydroxycyclohexane-1,2-dione acylhydrolase (decyclizing)